MANKLLDEARVERDKMTEPIILFLKTRSLYTQNDGIFTQEFHEGKTWLMYRIASDESTDAEVGKFTFQGQYPIFFSKAELPKPKKERNHPDLGLKEVELNLGIGDKVIGLYRNIIKEICGEGENEFDYGSLSKFDAANVLTLSERIYYIGQKVAQGKINEIGGLPYLEPHAIKSKIVCADIEERVINTAVATAERHLLPNHESMRKFFRGIIDLTVEVELDYITKVGEKNLKDNACPAGFGQVASVSATNARGWGSA